MWSNKGFSKIEEKQWFKGDTLCDKSAIKLGFSMYEEYIKGILINANNMLSSIANDDIFKYYFYNDECPDE